MRPRFQTIQTREDESFLAFRRVSDTGFGFNWHRHPDMELTLIEQGRGRRFVGDHIGEYGPGDLVLLGPDLPHTWHSDPNPKTSQDQAWVVQFKADWLGTTFMGRPELAELRRLFERAAGGLRFEHPATRPAMHRLLETSGLPRLIALMEILHTLTQCEGETLSSSAYAAPHLGDDRISRVCRFINQHITEPLPLELAAAEAGMAPASLSRFFRRATGRTFVSYVNELRIGHACRLLLETDLSISEIAYQVGFNNLSNFNRRFRKIRGEAPRDYRGRTRSAP